jgi:CheY-like chemotaxis protein
MLPRACGRAPPRNRPRAALLGNQTAACAEKISDWRKRLLLPTFSSKHARSSPSISIGKATAISVTAETPSPGGPTGARILVLEDDPTIRAGMRTLLERAGYSVRTARSPIEAIQLAADHELPIDLLVTDFGLHAVNGRQVAEVLLRDRPGMRVLFVSGHDEESVLPGGRRAGTAFLQKPFRPATLLERVHELLTQG